MTGQNYQVFLQNELPEQLEDFQGRVSSSGI
jgi:hypothetical protein